MKFLQRLFPGLLLSAGLFLTLVILDVVHFENSHRGDADDAARGVPDIDGNGHGHYIPPGGGDILVLRQPPIPGDVSIKVSPDMGNSTRFSMGTQDLPPTYAIPVHKHLYQDEVLFVIKGKGIATLGDKTFPVETGSTLYIPQGVWHTVVNDTDDPAQLLWITAGPGIENFFQRIGVKPGQPWTPLSLEELTRISAEYGMIIKSQ